MTRSGGLMSKNFSRGYGPQEFLVCSQLPFTIFNILFRSEKQLQGGTLLVLEYFLQLCNRMISINRTQFLFFLLLFHSEQGTTARFEIYTHFGNVEKEKCQIITRTLTQPKQFQKVAEIIWE